MCRFVLAVSSCFNTCISSVCALNWHPRLVLLPGMTKSTARQAQLQSDRCRTKAISLYLKDRRVRFEAQLVGDLSKNMKRLELLRLARISFKQESVVVQTQYMSRGEGAISSDRTEALVEVSGSPRRRATSASDEGGQRRPLTEAPLVEMSGSSSKQSVNLESESVQLGCDAAEPRVEASSRQGEPVTQTVDSLADVSSALIRRTQAKGVGGSGLLSLKELLTASLPRVIKVAGPAAGGEMLACACRLLDRYPKAFESRDLFSVKVAVLFGLAAKLTKPDDGVDIKKIWKAFGNGKFETRIRSLEVNVVNSMGKQELFSSGDVGTELS